MQESAYIIPFGDKVYMPVSRGTTSVYSLAVGEVDDKILLGRIQLWIHNGDSILAYYSTLE